MIIVMIVFGPAIFQSEQIMKTDGPKNKFDVETLLN